MKRINLILAAIAAVFLASCAEKIEEPSDGGARKTDYTAPVEGATFSLTASAEKNPDEKNPDASGAQPKALFNEMQLVWNEGDALNVFANSESSYRFDFVPVEGADWKSQGDTFCTTEFTPEDGVEYEYTALFPFTEGLTMDSEGWICETSGGVTSKKTYSLETATQKRSGDKSHLENMPLWGTATATGWTVPSVTMHNAVSVIEVETTNSLTSAPLEVTGVKLSSDCIVFGGEWFFNAKTGALEIKEGTGKSSVDLSCENLNDDGTKASMCETGGVLLNEIAVAPQTVTGTLTVELTTNQGTVTATRKLENLTFNAGRFRKLKITFDESLRDIFITPDANGTGDGTSWEKAFNITQFLDYVKQDTADSDNNAIRLDGRGFRFAGGTYTISERKIEFSGYDKQVKINLYGGYDPSSTGTDISRRDASAYETVFDGAGTNRFLLLGNQAELTFDGIVFANLHSNADSYGCITLLAGSSGDAVANFNGCVFRSCKNSYKQMPIILLGKGFAKLNGVTFDGCCCENGVRGLIRLKNIDSRAYLNSCLFVNNTYGGGGYGLLAHINIAGGNLCMYNVTYAGNDSGCSASGVVNGSGGMLIASSTLAASNGNPVVRCESDPGSGSVIVNSLLIQEKDKNAIDVSKSGMKLTSLGGNVIAGGIKTTGTYTASDSDDSYSTLSDASALSLSWNSDTKLYLWNGMTKFMKLKEAAVREAIASYSNTKTGQITTGYEVKTVVYDGSKAGEDFLKWLDSIGAFGSDCYGNVRSSTAHWPGSYQGE